MIYYVELARAGQPFHVLEFDIFDSEIARAWADVFDHVSGGQKIKISHLTPQTILTPGSIGKLNALWTEMISNVEAANQCGGYFDQHPIKIRRSINFAHEIHSAVLQEELNYLHLCFHEYEELALKSRSLSKSSLPYLRNLNVMIHNVEHCVNSLKEDAKSLTMCWKPGSDGHIGYGAPIVDKGLYQFFNQPWQPGDLVLGYATTGKNLYNCYLNNDVDLVRTGMVRPQTAITTETRLHWMDKGITAESIQIQKQNMEAWVLSNGLDRYIDYRSPEHGVVCEARIGHAKHAVEVDEIVAMITDDVLVETCWLVR